MIIPPILKSRKFWAAPLALDFALPCERGGITAETLHHAIFALISYILATALEDGLLDRV